MFANVTKNQHYVWKHYLQAWAVDEQLTCYRQRDGDTITTNPKNVASSRYFYGIETFTDTELHYLEAVAQGARTELGQRVNVDFVKLFTMTTRLRRLIASLPPADEETRQKTELLLKAAERGIGESWHVAIEQKGAPFLDMLRAGDASFWTNESEASDFCLYLGTQFTRTARMSKALRAVELPMGLNLARLLPVESHLWATEIGAGFVNHRATTLATVLKNETRTPFITGDQPVINLQLQTDAKSVFYYPITPKIALRLSTTQKDCEVKTEVVTQIEAERLNHDIFRWSEDQIYGVDGKYLEEIAALPTTLLVS